MITSVAVKRAVHPASQNVPIERRACPLRPGNTCASNAFAGRLGKGSDAWCVLLICSPFGNVTIIGLTDIFLLMHSVSNRM